MTAANIVHQPQSLVHTKTAAVTTTSKPTIADCLTEHSIKAIAEDATPKEMYAITITGLQLKNIFCYPKFYWYAIAALNGAQSAPGNIHASTNQYNLPNDLGQERDTLMTLTVWKNRAATLQYVYRDPSHIAAMKQIKNLSKYSKTYHYESTAIPTWEEAIEIWKAHGKEYDYNKKKHGHKENEDTQKETAIHVHESPEGSPLSTTVVPK